MGTYTTEITSDSLVSDNPIHQRLIKAYYLAQPFMEGDLLEVGCGEGRGIHLLEPSCNSYHAVDKIGAVLEQLRPKFPGVTFQQMTLPPLQGLADNSFDRVVSFQVIEHIKNDRFYLEEIYRVLKPGGLATRNPWHIREYQAQELQDLATSIFDQVEMKGIAGNEKVMKYYQQNKQSVERITRFDFLNLQYRLPAALLRIPYDLLNRINRNRLQKADQSLVSDISHEDYLMVDQAHTALDLMGFLHKH